MSSGEQFFSGKQQNIYMQFRKRDESPNETMEKPAIIEMLDAVQGKAVLDVGCGDGAFGQALLSAGADQYVGIDPSAEMLKLAQANCPAGVFVQSSAENHAYPTATIDIAISRLALHYVSDQGLETTLNGVHRALKPGGQWVCSVLHPVYTSCDKSSVNQPRQDWLVDDYFSPGSRQIPWLDGVVTRYHRTIETYFMLHQAAGFTVEHLREGRPEPANFSDPQLLARRKRMPLFLIFGCRKHK